MDRKVENIANVSAGWAFIRARPTPRDMDKKFFSLTEVLFLGANGALLGSKTKLLELWFQRKITEKSTYLEDENDLYTANFCLINIKFKVTSV